MKRLFPILAFALLLPTLASAQQVTFSLQAPPEGRTRAIVDSMELIFLISVNAEGADQSFDVTNAVKKSYTETILETDGMDVVKRKVVFDKVIERGNQPMQGVTMKTYAISGKTYIVENFDDSVSVIGEDGADVTKNERDEIADLFATGGGGQFSTFLNNRTMSVGEEIELTPEMLDQMRNGIAKGPMKPEKGKVKLVDLHEAQGMAAALLEIELTLVGRQGTLEMEFAMKGTAEVGVENLWPLTLVMKGAVTGAGNHAGMDLSADGEMRLARIATYE